MTGHGHGESTRDGFKIAVEVSTVNRRQLEVTVDLPREIEALDTRVREEAQRHISRGRMHVRVTLHSAKQGSLPRLRLNLALAMAYARDLQRLATELDLPGPLTIETLMRAPGVFEAPEIGELEARFWPALEQALRRALAALVRMRRREGVHLAADLARRLRQTRQSVSRIQRRAPAVVKRYRRQLQDRIASAGLGTPDPDDERLLREIVYFTDRSDVSEELTRLQSHFTQFQARLKSPEPVGRTLDFLVQEMNREVNTIGAKANDSLISGEIVQLKAELEKCREQIQNIE